MTDSDLVYGLSRFGLDARVVSAGEHFPEGLVRVRDSNGRDTIALVTQSTDGPEERSRAARTAERVLKNKIARYAVAVCCVGDVPENHIAERRYAWSIIRKGTADSNWVTGGVHGLAFTIALSPAGPREPENAGRALADSLVECNAAELVAVLPFSAATSQTFAKARRFLAKTYQLDFIVASHDDRHAGFSGPGKKAEVLLVCRPRSSVWESTPVSGSTSLAQNPSTAEDARDIVSDISDCIESGDESVHEFGSVQRIYHTELHDGDWGGVLFLSPLLRKRFLQLKRDDIIRVTTLGAVAEIGQTGSSVRRVFTLDHSTAQGMRKYKAFWGHDSDGARTMRVKAEIKIWARPEETTNADVCWERRSRLLLPGQPYLPSVGAMAVRLDEGTLGSM